MNNLTFGNERFQYYETLCSGAPAGPGFDGAAAVHAHMTNTRLTDPEILELRYPVLVEEFSIRRGSGGKGQWTSGDGTRRVIRFLERMDCAILSGYRHVRPFGLDGGEPGEAGANLVRRADGRLEAPPGLRRDRARGGRGHHHRHAHGRRRRPRLRSQPKTSNRRLPQWPSGFVRPPFSGDLQVPRALARCARITNHIGMPSAGVMDKKNETNRRGASTASAVLDPGGGLGIGRCRLSVGAIAKPDPGPQTGPDFTVRDITATLFRPSREIRSTIPTTASYLDLAGLDFKGAKLDHSDFFGADFTGANLRGTRSVAHTQLDRSVAMQHFRSVGANLSGATILRPTIRDLTKENLAVRALQNRDLSGVRINARMSGSDFGADRAGANLNERRSRAGGARSPR